MQAKVREATSNDPWGPSGSQMNELAAASHNQHEFLEIMEILDKRMNDKGKNWRHVFKALTVLDYLLHVGSESVVKYARENLYIVKTLKEFQYIDEEGKDQGSNVRQKAKDITALLSDDARLKEERRSRNAMNDRMSGRAHGADRYEQHTPVYERPGATDEERDLQRALEESRRMAQVENTSRNSEDDDLKKALELSKKEEQDRIKTVEKYNELSLTEDWEADSKPVNRYEQQNNTDFFGNDFGGQNNNSNNFDAFSPINEYGNSNNGFLQQQATGFNNNPYLQFQQQQLQQQQMQQQQLMQQQMMQQQLQQQQQMAFLNTMNNPYQQQLMPQMTGAPNLGSNNPFSAFAQKPAMTGQPTGMNGMNGFNNSNNNSNSNGLHNGASSSNNPLGDLAFLQNSMTGMPATSQPAAVKASNPNDEKYAHLAMALSNRDDGMDTFGNTGQLRIPSHTSFGLGNRGANANGVAANPFQNLGGAGANNNSALIDIGDSGSGLGRSNSNNPFQMAGGQTNSGFLSSQATGFGAMNGNGFGQTAGQANGNSGAYSNNLLF
ncbi:hypothetical protein BGZ95_004055 [Linnemannia exigua]|uniref:ENTH domain-containing protein n=1 Tax=Linnemannia exigua TaxID=604196 RepID=A0AAD4D3F4_9FUNG|nr:hypothetical protein BGZ95_004055 [Linnemannia exigua]